MCMIGMAKDFFVIENETFYFGKALRLPELILKELRLIANKRDVPYHSLIKEFKRTYRPRTETIHVG